MALTVLRDPPTPPFASPWPPPSSTSPLPFFPLSSINGRRNGRLSVKNATSSSVSGHCFLRNRHRSWRRGLHSSICKMAETDGKSVITSDVDSGKMIFEPILEEGVFRFDCSVDDRNAAFPSLSFVNFNVRDTPIASHKIPAFVPNFGLVSDQQIVKLELPSGTSFYGAGEVSGQLERTGKRVFTWNTDAWGYGPGTTSLYQSHPWVLAVCLMEKPLLSLLTQLGDVRNSIYASEVVTGLSSMSLEVARTFREKGIPCDVIWMDIDYMDGH